MNISKKRLIKKIAFLMIVICLSCVVWGSRRFLSISCIEKARQALCQHIQAGVAKKIRCALFSPDDDIESVLVGLIDAEASSIIAAQYMLSSAAIADALKRAYLRGVRVELVTDKFCSKSAIGKMQLLAARGVPVYEYDPTCAYNKQTRRESLMHHKFFVFSSTLDGRTLLVSGSFNCTLSATTQNQENLLFLEDTVLVESFKKQFELLKKRSSLIVPN